MAAVVGGLCGNALALFGRGGGLRWRGAVAHSEITGGLSRGRRSDPAGAAMKVFITGASGFIGSVVARKLAALLTAESLR